MATTLHTGKLGELVTFKTGKLDSNAAVPNGDYPFFTCSQETLRTNTYSFDTECVLLAGNNANGIFPLKYFKGKFDAYQRTYIVRPRDMNVLNTRFLYYALRLKLSEFRSFSTGAATKFLTLTILNETEIQAPPLPVQRRIAGILSAYDELIENSQRRIKILEAMARTLYREWFVHFRFPGHESIPRVPSALGEIPQGWEITTLGSLVEIRKGKNITKNTIRNGNVPVVAGGITPAYFHDVPNTQGPVITISASGANAGFLNLYNGDIWASDCSYIDSSATPHVFYYYLWLDHRRSAITNLQRGSAQPHVNPKDLAQLDTIKAPDEVVNTFTSQITPIFNLKMRLASRIDNLRRTRDLLLPRLLSGQVELTPLKGEEATL
jgi:type I restriction enzyme S subunit